jgi:release factor glutamine methyltransferase
MIATATILRRTSLAFVGNAARRQRSSIHRMVGVGVPIRHRQQPRLRRCGVSLLPEDCTTWPTTSQRRYASNDGDTRINAHEKYIHQTVPDVLQTAVDEFNATGISEPLHSAIQLLALSLNLPWITGFRDLMQMHEHDQNTSRHDGLSRRRLTAAEAVHYDSLVNRRLHHEPIQYIAGQWDFLEYTLTVRAPLLCPRPETEELVMLVLDDLKKMKRNDTIRILDVGCGTGCIGIALADKIPECTVTALDVEPVAVETAAANAARIGCQQRYDVQLIAAENFHVADHTKRFDVVVSNPPYIPAPDMLNLEATVLNFESATALQGGSDGMDVIRTIVQQLPLWSKPGAVCWMEVDPTHPAMLREWLNSTTTRKVKFVSSHRDMYGRDRFVKLRVVDP